MPSPVSFIFILRMKYFEGIEIKKKKRLRNGSPQYNRDIAFGRFDRASFAFAFHYFPLPDNFQSLPSERPLQTIFSISVVHVIISSFQHFVRYHAKKMFNCNCLWEWEEYVLLMRDAHQKSVMCV